MHWRYLSVYLLLMFGVLLAQAPAAEAQLFGWGNGPAAPIARTPQRAMSVFSRWNPFSFSSSRLPRSYAEEDDEDRGGYRTFCVRLCDGYYFPISYRTTRSKMYRESKICEASCDCETRLYFLPSASSDIAHMTDLSGLTYKNLDNAFEYRSRWDEACSCKPVPWSVAEASRHEEYAALAEEQEMVARRRMEVLVARAESKQEKKPDLPGPEAVIASAAIAVPDVSVATPPLLADSAAIQSEAPKSESSIVIASHSLTPDFLAAALAPQQEQPVTATEALTDSKPQATKSQRRLARLQARPKRQGSRGLFQF